MKNKREKLFVYGTLKNPEVQKKVIGRVAKAELDTLEGYKKSTIKINDNVYPILVADLGSITKGFVLSVSSSELKSINGYETAVYRREKIVLKSGKRAWVYCK